MAIEEREIGVNEVAIGMFVCRLDRPWTETPFPLQGFLVRDVSQLEALGACCSRVWIDIDRGTPDPRLTLQRLGRARPAQKEPLKPGESVLHREVYVDSATLEEETPVARLALDEASRLTARIVNDVQAGLALTPEEVRGAATSIVASVLRNADALFWANALREHDGYAYSHAINCSALAAAFGRHLGIPADILVNISSGALLLDIGKMRVPDEVIHHPGPLNPLSMARARRHVELGLQILEEAGERNPVIIEIVAGHHERADGSGYPLRRRGSDIPLYARMTAIIDSFDAMTSDRPYARALPRYDALQHLYEARDSLYHGELVEQFISCLGVYPTGSLVELNTGEVAAVMAQNPSRRLRPRIMLLTDPDKQLTPGFRPLDLMDMPMAGDVRIAIRRPLAAGEFGIDLAELYL